MPCISCTTNSFRSISIAMAKAASARLRNIGAGRVAANWTQRAAICETCPMRVVSRGVSYCGTPFLQLVDRDPVVDGCGCPTRDKARSPDEHCPVDRNFSLPVVQGRCNCKWCERGSLEQRNANANLRTAHVQHGDDSDSSGALAITTAA